MGIEFEPGKYRGRLQQHSLTEAKTGTTQIAWVFEIIGQYIGGNLGECPLSGKLRTVFRALTEATAERAASEARSLGLQGSDWGALDPDSGDAFQNLAGAETDLFCKHDEYQGNVNEKWELVGGSFQFTKAGADKIRKLNAQFGGILKGAPVAGAPGPLQPSSNGVHNAKSPPTKKPTQPKSTPATPNHDADPF